MSIISNGNKIIKIMDDAENVIADLRTKLVVADEPPLVFTADGGNLADYSISGNTGGVGDFDNTTNKYVIPVTTRSKNILINNLTSQTYNGLTLTVNADKSITVNGTASDDTTFYICDGSYRVSNAILQEIDNGSYYISGAPEGAEENKYVLSYLFKRTLSTTSQTFRVPADQEVPIYNVDGKYHYFAVSFTVWSGISVTNVTFKPMLRAVGTTSTYEPQFENTVNIELDAPLAASETATKASTSINIPVGVGTNTLTVGTTVQPREIMVKDDIKYVSSGALTTYTISYYSQDGQTLLHTETVVSGGDGIYDGTPSKASTAQYNYSFAGWSTSTNSTSATSGARTNITTNTVLYAAFSQTTRTYTVYFYNESTLLQTVQNVPYGGSATYTGTEPTKTDCTFNGWSPLPSNITADTSCYAQFIAPYITDSWDVISARSNAGTAQNYYSVGDCKPVYLNGTMGTLALDTTLYVYILGFDHNISIEAPFASDVVISDDDERAYSHSITFGGFKTNYGDSGINVALCDANYSSYNTSGSKWFNMNHRQGSSVNGHNYGGWKGCDMRYDILGSTYRAPSGYGAKATTSNVGYDAMNICVTNPVSNTLMSCLPSELRSVMKPVMKYTDNKGNSSNVEANVTSSKDYLPLLSEYEVYGARSYANQYEQNKQAQYAYYVSGNSKVKYRHTATSSSADWWVRSPSYRNSYTFCYVGAPGGFVSTDYSRYSYGVAPCFLV